MSVEVSDSINFINNLGSIEPDRLSSISGSRFFEILITRYEKPTVQSAVKSIFTTPDATYTGMKNFKDRITNSLLPGGKLSGADQVYLNNYCQRFFLQRSK